MAVIDKGAKMPMNKFPPDCFMNKIRGLEIFSPMVKNLQLHHHKDQTRRLRIDMPRTSQNNSIS